VLLIAPEGIEMKEIEDEIKGNKFS
jgi:hypothetical protein